MKIEWILRGFDDLSNDELYDLMQLRQIVFIVEQNCPYLDADGKDHKGYHLLGYASGKQVACARLLPAGVSYGEASIGRVVTHPDYRKMGIGRKLMSEALAAIAELYGNQPLRIGAQQYLKKFYEDFGFMQEGAPYMEDGIPHIIMYRQPVSF